MAALPPVFLKPYLVNSDWRRVVRYELKSGIPECFEEPFGGGGEAFFLGFLVATALAAAVSATAVLVAVTRAAAVGAADVLRFLVWIPTDDGRLTGRLGGRTGSRVDSATLHPLPSVRVPSFDDDGSECVGESDRRGKIGCSDDDGKRDRGCIGDNAGKGEHSVPGLGTGGDDSVRSIVTRFCCESATGLVCSGL